MLLYVIAIFLTICSADIKGEEIFVHKNSKKYLISLANGKVRFILKTNSAKLQKVSLVLIDGDKKEKIGMEYVGQKKGMYYFYADREVGDDFEYYFSFEVNKVEKFFSAAGTSLELSKSNFRGSNTPRNYCPPLWLKGASIYQISIDKFRRGSGDNLNEELWKSDWNNMSIEDRCFKVYGGNFKGISEKLDYINKIANTIYLSSPLSSPSNHKFDGSPFDHVDPQFSSQKSCDNIVVGSSSLDIGREFSSADHQFFNMVDEIHNAGMKVIIFFPLLYSSRYSTHFNDIVTYGAESKYIDWYMVDIKTFEDLIIYEGKCDIGVEHIDGIKYRRRWIKPLKSFDDQTRAEIEEWNRANILCKSFDEKGNLPLLNLNNVECKESIIEAICRWVDGRDGKVDGIDGIVFDINKDVESRIGSILEIRDRLKENNKELAFCVNPLNAKLSSRLLEISDLNFVHYFMDPFINLLEEDSVEAEDIKSYLSLLKLRFPNMPAGVMSSWDTCRILSQFIKGDKNGREIRPDLLDQRVLKLMKMAAVINYTFFDTPLIYYGDEVGMYGTEDPNNRKPMLWKDLGIYDNESDNLSKYSGFELKGVEIFEATDKIEYSNTINVQIENLYIELASLKNNFISSDKKVCFKKVKGSRFVLCYEVILEGESLVIAINLSNFRQKFEISLNGKEYIDLLGLNKNLVYKTLSGKLLMEMEPLDTILIRKIR